MMWPWSTREAVTRADDLQVAVGDGALAGESAGESAGVVRRWRWRRGEAAVTPYPAPVEGPSAVDVEVALPVTVELAPTVEVPTLADDRRPLAPAVEPLVAAARADAPREPGLVATVVARALVAIAFALPGTQARHGSERQRRPAPRGRRRDG